MRLDLALKHFNITVTKDLQKGTMCKKKTSVAAYVSCVVGMWIIIHIFSNMITGEQE